MRQIFRSAISRSYGACIYIITFAKKLQTSLPWACTMSHSPMPRLLVFLHHHSRTFRWLRLAGCLGRNVDSPQWLVGARSGPGLCPQHDWQAALISSSCTSPPVLGGEGLSLSFLGWEESSVPSQVLESRKVCSYGRGGSWAQSGEGTVLVFGRRGSQ